jgi:hypothetical protein
MLPEEGHAQKQQVIRAPRGLTGRNGRQLRKTLGFATMTSEILHLAGQFQLWVNRLVARHLEAEAAKFVR